MIMQRRNLTDKLEAFVLSGIAKSTSGWDYAIPQAWCDQLTRMGVDNPGRWFAADCTGPSAFPVIHHVGEAYIAIAEHRSKANGEIWQSLFTLAYTKGVSEDSRSLYNHVQSNQRLLDDTDCGFTDLNFVIEAFTAGMKAEAQSDNRAEIILLGRVLQDIECYCTDAGKALGTPCLRCETEAFLSNRKQPCQN